MFLYRLQLLCLVFFFSSSVLASNEPIADSVCEDEAAVKRMEEAVWYTNGWVWLGISELVAGSVLSLMSLIITPIMPMVGFSLVLMSCGLLCGGGWGLLGGVWGISEEREVAKKCRDLQKANDQSQVDMRY